MAHSSVSSGYVNRKSGGSTPTTVYGREARCLPRPVMNLRGRPRTPGSLPNARSQRPWLRTTRSSRPSASSAGEKTRPTAAPVPRTEKKFGVTSPARRRSARSGNTRSKRASRVPSHIFKTARSENTPTERSRHRRTIPLVVKSGCDAPFGRLLVAQTITILSGRS